VCTAASLTWSALPSESPPGGVQRALLRVRRLHDHCGPGSLRQGRPARRPGPQGAGTPAPVLVAPQCQQLEEGSCNGSLRFMRGTLRVRVGSLSALGGHWQRRGLQRERRGDIRALAGLSGPVKLSGGGHCIIGLTLGAPRAGTRASTVGRGTSGCHCGTSGYVAGPGPCCLLVVA
jgi:hypothetical protein